MNVFVLSNALCGTHTFVKACSHITNFTSGHETRGKQIRADRIAYPSNHIEIDNHLSWFLGRLDVRYGKEGYYVHLTRNPEELARSMSRYWNSLGSVNHAWRNAILQGTSASFLDACRDRVAAVNENISLFLKDKPNQMVVSLETAKTDFREFWHWIGAEGDLESALAEWDIRYHRTPGSIGMALQNAKRLAKRVVQFAR